MTRLGIDGFGRIGRLVVRGLSRHPGLELVHVNEPHADAATSAHLLAVDSVHGRFDGAVGPDAGAITLDGRRVTHTSHDTPGAAAESL